MAMATFTPDLKVMTLEKAIERYVKNGAHISIGGFTVNRNPMAAVYEIIRQKITNLHMYAHSNGQGLDELIGAGSVSKVEIAYSGNGRFAPTCICFKRACIDNKIMVEDYSNFQMALRFLAGAMGIPFLPTTACLGTDIIHKWGFNSRFRQTDPKISDKKLVVMENPFFGSDSSEKVVLVPAIHPDVTLIHAQQADKVGTTCIHGLTFADIEQAKASQAVIVTCDELCEPGRLNQSPGKNQLPSFCVDAVVHIPFGAYPTACYGLYDYDAAFLEFYGDSALDEPGFNAYLDEFILGTKTHRAFIEKALGNRLEDIKADPEKGYSTQLKRR